METYREKKIETLLDAVKSSAQRSRQAFLFAGLGAVIIICADFNAYFSWQRHYTLAQRFNFSNVYDFTAKDQVIDSLKKLTYYSSHTKSPDSLVQVLNRNLTENNTEL